MLKKFYVTRQEFNNYILKEMSKRLEIEMAMDATLRHLEQRVDKLVSFFGLVELPPTFKCETSKFEWGIDENNKARPKVANRKK